MYADIGKQILRLRKSKRISQTELANFLETQPQTVSKWERGICAPDIAKIPQIAAFFGITIDELFGAKKHDKETALSETNELILQKRWSLAANKAAAMAIEFPSEKQFVQKLLMSMSQALLCKERFQKKFIEKAVILGKRALQETSEPNLKNDIIHSLCELLYLLHRDEDADFFREMLPSAAICRETLDIYKHNGSALIENSKKNISLYYALIGASFSAISENVDEIELSAQYIKNAVCAYEQAYKHSKNEKYIHNIMLLKLSLANIYFSMNESAVADALIKEAKLLAHKYSLENVYFKYAEFTER